MVASAPKRLGRPRPSINITHRSLIVFVPVHWRHDRWARSHCASTSVSGHGLPQMANVIIPATRSPTRRALRPTYVHGGQTSGLSFGLGQGQRIGFNARHTARHHGDLTRTGMVRNRPSLVFFPGSVECCVKFKGDGALELLEWNMTEGKNLQGPSSVSADQSNLVQPSPVGICVPHVNRSPLLGTDEDHKDSKAGC